MQMRDIEIEQKETINRSQKCIERMRRGSRCLFNCSLITSNSGINAPIIVYSIYIDVSNGDRI